MGIAEMSFKLLLAFLLGGLIGIERQTHGRPAGLRTHILVCLGSTLLTLCSYRIADAHNNDPGRIAAQIVTGIGFLGAGTIMRQGSVIRGLTTAASVWAMSAVGIAIGIGGDMIYLAVVGSVLVFVTLNLIPHVESLVFVRRGEKMLTTTTRRDPDALVRILDMLRKYDPGAHLLSAEETANDTHALRFHLRTGRDFNQDSLNNELAASLDVMSYTWE
jgi:putative Mg2+ transporter-C (MgtC) family protein